MCLDLNGVLLDHGLGNGDEVVVEEEVICACRLRERIDGVIGVVVVVGHFGGLRSVSGMNECG